MERIKTMNLPNCATCSVAFSSAGYSLLKNIRLPLLLHCGHSSCEPCLMKELSDKKEIQCKICDEISTLSESFSQDELTKEFPINHYLAGMCYLKIASNTSDLDSTIGFSQPKLNKKKKYLNRIICHECSDVTADYHCNQCEVPYCSSCYKLVHSFAKAFRSHTYMLIHESYFNFDFEKPLSCFFHSSYKLEYFCTSCRTPICSHCIVESHNGHPVNKLGEVDIDYEEDFIQHYMKLTNHLNRMAASKKIAENILENDVLEITKTEEEVTNYFVLLHGKLVLLENQIRKNLSTTAVRCSLEEIINKMKTYIEDTETLLASTRTLMLSDLNIGTKFMAVTENMKSRLRLPAHFIESEDWKMPRFHVDKEFIKTLENHCKLEFSTSDRYQLVNEENIPPGYKVPPIKELTREEIIPLLKKPFHRSDSVSFEESERPIRSPSLDSERSYSSQTRDPPSQALHYADEIAIGCSVSVCISHLISPSLFYVQREYAKKKLLEFQASLRHSQINKNSPPSRPEKGKVYLALYGEDRKWYRARIVNIIDPNTYEVFYVDFGNSEVLDRGRIRGVPKSSLNFPFMAYRCQLNNCVPRFGTEWDPRAIALMTEIIDDDFVTMTVVDKTPLHYIVDLYKITDNSFINLREALSFHELASMSAMFSQEIDISVKQNLTTPPQRDYPLGELISVHVSHVISPHEFYVQDLSYSRKLIQLTEDLQRAYNIRNSNKYIIYDPKKGMLIAARYSKDSKWYRAIIIECLVGKQVKVFFIDFGGEEKVSFENIKLISSRFVKLSPQAIRCSLCDVAPLNDGDCWVEEVCQRFHETIFDKIFKVVAGKVENGLLACVMYELREEYDICINAYIVSDLLLAVSTGPSSAIVRFSKQSSSSKPPVEEDSSCQDTSVEKTKIKKKMIKTSKVVEGHSSQHFITMPDGSVRINVSVKTVVSPGEFYVVPSCFKEKVRNLKNSLQEFYGKKQTSDDIKWKADDKCVVNCDLAWHRAVVLQVLSDGQIKLYLVDEGSEKTVESKFVFVMDPSFSKIPDGVVKCHLAGLEPQLATWSALAKCEFEEFVNNMKHDLYISQLGKMKDNSLPVELFSLVRLDAGPTEPIKDDWKSYNHYLRFVGFAKADNIIKWDCDGNVLSIKNEDSNDNTVSHLDELIKNSLNLNKEECTTPPPPEMQSTNDSDEVKVAREAWLPPEPLENLELIAAPTFVDENCIVYFHDVEKSGHLLEEISTALCTKYDNSLPHLHDATVEPGDMCIAKYHLDNKWYRALLLEKFIVTNEFKIQFVDYGNVEVCKLADIRKATVSQNIPIQCHRCRFYKLGPADPKGVWQERHIEIIQYTLVDKQVKLRLFEMPDSDIYGVDELILPDGTDYEAEMVKQSFARYKRSGLYKTKELISLSEAQELLDSLNSAELEPHQIKFNEKGLPLVHWSSILETLSPKEMPKFRYRALSIPPSVKFMIVEVSAFLTPTDVILHILDVDDDPVILKMIENFKKMSTKMQSEGPIQAPLYPPYIYQPCCAPFSLDDQWYRGFVLGRHPDNNLLVQFVDYGNVEPVPTVWVHELREEWAFLEVQSILVSLHNIEVSKHYNMNEVMQPLQDCLSNGPIKAEIVERDPCLQVDLFIDEKLAYQDLLDSKMFVYKSK